MKSILLALGKLMSFRMLAIGLTFMQTVVMTRVFGSETFGLLSFAISISALCVMTLSIGLDQVLSRDIARIGKDRVAQSKRWAHLWRLIRWGVVPLVLVTSSAGALLVYLTPIAGGYRLTVLTALIIVPVILLRKYLEAISLGTKQVLRSITGSQLVFPSLMIFVAGLVGLFHITPDSKTVALTYGISAIGSMIASALLIAGTIRKIQDRANAPISDDRTLKESPGSRALMKSGMHFSLVSLGFILSQHIDVLLTGVLSSPQEVALVRVASRIAEVAGLMRAIIVLQYRPIISEAHGLNDRIAIEKHVDFMLKIFVLSGGAITVFVMIFAEEILLVFGPEFAIAGNALRVYVSGVFLTLILGPGDVVLSQTDNEHFVSRALMTALAVQFVLDLILIPIWGVEGCAVANLTAMLVASLIVRFRAKRVYGIETSFLRLLHGHYQR